MEENKLVKENKLKDDKTELMEIEEIEALRYKDPKKYEEACKEYHGPVLKVVGDYIEGQKYREK